MTGFLGFLLFPGCAPAMGDRADQASRVWSTAAAFSEPLVGAGPVLLYRSSRARLSPHPPSPRADTWHALDPANGQERWSYTLPASIHGAPRPVAAGGCVLFWDAEGHLRGVDETDGRERWRTHVKRGTSPADDAPPAIDGGLAWFASSEAIVRVDLSTGEEHVAVPMSQPPLSQVVVEDGVLLLVTSDGLLRAFGAADGSPLWTAGDPAKASEGHLARTPPSVAYGRVSARYADLSGQPRELRTGVPVDAADRVGCLPMLDLLVCRVGGSVQVRDPLTGSDRWRWGAAKETGDDLGLALASPRVVKGPLPLLPVLTLLDDDGIVQAWEVRTAARLWVVPRAPWEPKRVDYAVVGGLVAVATAEEISGWSPPSPQ